MFILIANHAVFLIGLSLIGQNKYSLITKQINSSATAVIAMLIVYTFYSYRKRNFINQARLKENENNLRTLFEVNPYPMILTRLSDSKIMLINKMAMDFYRLSPDTDTLENTITHYKNIDDRLAILTELHSTGRVKNYIMEHKVSSDEFKWVMVNCELIDYGEEQCILTGITDITELKKIEGELTMHASIDTLTGIMNRRHGMESLSLQLSQAEKQSMDFIVCFIDINGLKETNDKYGHSEGDDLILTVCQHIKSRINEEDVFFRYGGDEFIIGFSNKTMEAIQSIWQQIIQDLDEITNNAVKPFPISVSYGMHRYDSDSALSLEEMIKSADNEMYLYKSEIKVSRSIWTP